MKNNLKIALVHDYFMQYGGAERVFESIYDLFPNADVFCPVVDAEILKKITPPVKKIHTSRFFSHKFVKKYYRMFLLFYPVVIEKFDFSKYDLVISDSSAWVKNIITPPETVH
ncbi:glycosyltransferase family 4 protein, partial [bacterium]|nr:glycosyltransferase family 4 protein [bacterium]